VVRVFSFRGTWPGLTHDGMGDRSIGGILYADDSKVVKWRVAVELTLAVALHSYSRE
jgi:hypothetical protein